MSADRTYSVPHRRLRLLSSLLDAAADLGDLCLADAPWEADERHAAHLDHAVRAVSYIATQIAASVSCHIPCSSLDLPGSTFGDDLRAIAREADAVDDGNGPAGGSSSAGGDDGDADPTAGDDPPDLADAAVAAVRAMAAAHYPLAGGVAIVIDPANPLLPDAVVPVFGRVPGCIPWTPL